MNYIKLAVDYIYTDVADSKILGSLNLGEQSKLIVQAVRVTEPQLTETLSSMFMLLSRNGHSVLSQTD